MLWIASVLVLALLAGTAHGTKVAIVGAGIGGASAAHFLSALTDSTVEITVLEKADQVGGRIHEATLAGVLLETGATAIHSSNQYMTGFVTAANLSFNGDDGTPSADRGDCAGGKGGVGIWDGASFRFSTTPGDSDLTTMIKTAWRYGLSPLFAKNQVSDTVTAWAKVYDTLGDQSVGFSDLYDMFEHLGLTNVLSQQAEDYLKSKWISARFIEEFADGVSRVNYGQSAVEMNAFADLVSLAGAGLSGSVDSVKGGNTQVVDYLLQNSKLVLNAQVTKVSVQTDSNKLVEWTEAGKSFSDSFDVVILAAPYHLAGISGNGFEEPSVVPYKTTHVTFVEGLVNPTAFGVSDCKVFPDTITTVDGTSSFFRSLSFKAPSTKDDSLNVYKLFSNNVLSEEQLTEAFSIVSSVMRFKYEAYPVESPLSNEQQKSRKFDLGNGVFYVNAIEGSASCMEVDAIGGRNTALLAKAFIEKNTV